MGVPGDLCLRYDVISKDALNYHVPTAAARTVTISGAGSGGTFSDAACSVATSAVDLAAGTSIASFYFKDAVAQTLTLVATDASATLAPASLSVFVHRPLALGLYAPPMPVGTCAYFSVSTIDALPARETTISGVNFALSSGGASAVFYSDAACTNAITGGIIAAGQSYVTLYWKDPVVESFMVTATDLASALTTGTWNSGSY